MAHFAEIDADNVVTRVIVVPDEHEADGAAWCAALLGGRWVQTSYNGSIRRHFAGIGYTYDADLDAFVPPRPYPSWVLDEVACQWVAPVPCPPEGRHVWDEASRSWLPLD